LFTIATIVSGVAALSLSIAFTLTLEVGTGYVVEQKLKARPEQVLVAFPQVPKELFALTTAGELWRSYSYAKRWVPVESAVDNCDDVLTFGGEVFTADSHGVYVSRDMGDSWSAARGSFPEDAWNLSLAANGDALFMRCGIGENWTLHKLSGFTGNWQQVNGIPSAFAGPFLFLGDRLYAWRHFSTDGGGSWNTVSGFDNVLTYFKTGRHTYAGVKPFPPPETGIPLE